MFLNSVFLGLGEMARKMGTKECSREKIGKKEEHYRHQMKQLNLMLKEAEHRAELKEEDQQKMELVIAQMGQEMKIFQRMTSEHQQNVKK